MTGLYNLVEKLRAGTALTPAEEGDARDARARIVLQLHDRLDAAVAAAYGWPAGLSPAEIVIGGAFVSPPSQSVSRVPFNSAGSPRGGQARVTSSFAARTALAARKPEESSERVIGNDQSTDTGRNSNNQ